MLISFVTTFMVGPSMSIIKRRRGNTTQVILRLTRKQFYLGTEDKIDPERVYEALSYLSDKIATRHKKDLEYFGRVEQMLENLLPEEARRRLQTEQAQLAKVAVSKLVVLTTEGQEIAIDVQDTAKSTSKRSTLYLPERYIEALDSMVEEYFHSGRAQAIREAIRSLLKENLWDQSK
jgi:hypothetical protein